MVPLTITIVILSLNFLGVYWQDLGHANQSSILQFLQYAAKAHEMMMAASLTTIIIHQTQHDLSRRKGVPFGFLTAGFQLSRPSLIFTKGFYGGVTARTPSIKLSRFLQMGILIILGVGLTSVVGPSSAVAMIPRLDWWDVPQAKAFGPDYIDRLYFNRTKEELWPAEITNAIYANVSDCSATNLVNQDCAVRAMDSTWAWVSNHQVRGTKPNVTVLQDTEVIRFLTSEGGPPDNSSWTVTSTVGSIFALDLDHYWDWLVENSTLPTNINRPLLRPSFVDPTLKVKKPLVQAQCQTYLDPDWKNGNFDFPHDQLLTPPLNDFKDDAWGLPNKFILDLKGGNASEVGDKNDTSDPWMFFDWFDLASNFTNQGAPSLGAVLIYLTRNETTLINALTTCSFDSRWTPVQYSLDPTDTITIRQNSPNPMDILNGSSKASPEDLTQMKISLDWANTLTVHGASAFNPPANVVEQLFEGFGDGNFIWPEPEPRGETPGTHWMKSLDWRISTTLGLYLTEGLARAFQDIDKGSMLYRQAPHVEQSYVRYLNNINNSSGTKEGYNHDGQLDWVEMRDPRWNTSIQPWDIWAPQNGYTEMAITVQRYGYGYGLQDVPIKLAITVLLIYAVLVSVHIVVFLVRGRTYKGYADMGEILALAWNSAPAEALVNTSAGIEKLRTWRHVVRIREGGGMQLQLVLRDDGDQNDGIPGLEPKLGAKYS